ncbi:DNA methyltransferase [Bifidobacterium animalis subsp. animalis]|uniref:site-specific DNA-methyltransferase n=1 Tax=Bifidobacterium animalis TaxID=28025 RepID=UPI001020DEAB|nr:site-specific DNA-methyltransferase [Bifidobacterium animalis]RYN13715.1 DNA methyltransferase [Bifidobacterium animalis subsp. animalis]
MTDNEYERVVTSTSDITEENIAKIAELFPDVVTEVEKTDGMATVIDFDVLKAKLGDVAEGMRERYQFTWPGKRAAKAEARIPIDKTMRPVLERSKDWDVTQNLYIEGDNLDALKILRETYAGKVKLIYIDPPYNTGHDFIYKDDFRKTAAEGRAENGDFDDEGARLVTNLETNGRFHSDWCSMIYPRLLLARDLLTDDGVIFISIDDGEQANLRKICDEVFGSGNFVANLIWKSTPGSNTGTMIKTVTETVMTYCKNISSVQFETTRCLIESATPLSDL